MPIKTRHQRLQEAEAGAQPSPPRSLTDEPRAKRSRTNKSSAPAPQDPPVTRPFASGQTSTTAQASTSKRSTKATQRGGRGKGRTRPAPSAQTHIQDDAPQVSDASTQPDIAADSDASAQVDGDATRLMGDTDGETQTSRLDLEATHPVFAGTPTARVVNDANGETQTSRSGSGATQPVYAATPTPTSAQPVQGKRSPSETSELFRQILSSPSSSTTSVTNHGTPIVQPSPTTSATNYGTPIVQASPITSATNHGTPIVQVSPTTSVTNHGTPIVQASRSSLTATQSVLAGTSPSIGAQPVLQGPMASSPCPVMPKVYGLPAERAKNYSLIHILVDSLPATTGKGPIPRQDSNIAFAVPSSEIPKLLTLASRHIPGLKDMTKEHPVASNFADRHKLTYERFTDTFTSNPLRKRKRNEEEETPKTVATHEAAAKSVGRAMRHAFVNMADERRRVALEESRFQARSPEIEVHEELLIDTRETSDNPYTNEEVPDSDEGPVQGLTNSQDQVQQEQVPETPPARGWGLSSFFPSVSRFIPFSSRRTPSAAGAPPRVAPDIQVPAESLTTNEPSPDDLAAPQQPLESRLGAQTEPRQRSDTTDSRHDGQGLTTSSAFAQRVHREKPQRILLTKKQAEERQRLKQEKEQLRADREHLIQEEARIAQEKKEWEEERARATGAQRPGTKRKRVPSPETYPLPARGFGLVDAIFQYSSDEESSEEEQDTPTRPRANKKARLSSSSMDLNGGPGASPYEGGSFVGAGATSEGAHGNVFGKKASINAEASMTPPSGPSRNTFAVPSPTDSDPDEEAVGGEFANATPLPSQQDQSSQVTTASPPKSMPPPPTPNPSHATLPLIPIPTWALDPIQKAREKALKHQPKYGSRLRESRRLSSSPAGPETGIQPREGNTQVDQSQYDPKSPAMLPNIFPTPRSPARLPNIFPSNQASSAFGGSQAENAADGTTVRHGYAPWDGKGFSYDSYRKTMTPNVEAHIEVTWDEDGDDVLIGLGDEQFDAAFEAWKQKQGSEEAMGDSAKSSSNAVEPDQLSYEKADISAKVRALIDENVTEEDEAMAVNEFDEEYAAWKAKEMQKQGTLVPSVIA